MPAAINAVVASSIAMFMKRSSAARVAAAAARFAQSRAAIRPAQGQPNDAA
jgi:hypothetical protein